MSQELPKSQPPLSPNRERVSRKPLLNRDSDSQRTSNRVQSVLKAQSIKMRGTIVLEGNRETGSRTSGRWRDSPAEFLDKLQLGWSAG